MGRATRCSLILACTLAIASASPALGAKSKLVTPVLSGTVYLPDGRPAPHAVLTAVGWRNSYVGGEQGGSSYWTSMLTIHTDAHGRFRSRLNAPPNNMVNPPVIIESAARWDVTLLSQQGIGYAVGITLQAKVGQSQLHQDIHLQRGDRVSGTVTGYPGGRPLSGVRVTACLFSGVTKNFVVSETRTDTLGHFRVPAELPPGEYTVGAEAPGTGLVEDFRSARNHPAQEYSIELHLVRDFTLRGQVLNADSSPLRNQKLDLSLVDPRPRGQTHGWSVTTDREGRFTAAVTWCDDEFNRWRREAAERYEASVTYGGRTSPRVTLEPMKSSQITAVFRLE